MVSLSPIERQMWMAFHETAYKEDLLLAEKLTNEHPRWVIIIGYYAMHDIAKLYLGKVHNIKITPPDIHKKTIDELRKVLIENEEKRKILSLLEQAEKELLRLGIDAIPDLLEVGKTERGKAQYYSREFKRIDYSNKAQSFLNNIVKTFVKIMEGLCC